MDQRHARAMGVLLTATQAVALPSIAAAPDPKVTLEVGTEKFEATARIAEEPERTRLYDQQAAMMPAFKDYEAKTTRVIPVVVLERG